jgi:hypothetical protein
LASNEEKSLTKQQRYQNGRLIAILFIAASCGPRQREILGLRWEGTDLNKGSVYISQSAQSIY